jgi:hypothetical protein
MPTLTFYRFLPPWLMAPPDCPGCPGIQKLQLAVRAARGKQGGDAMYHVPPPGLPALLPAYLRHALPRVRRWKPGAGPPQVQCKTPSATWGRFQKNCSLGEDSPLMDRSLCAREVAPSIEAVINGNLLLRRALFIGVCTVTPHLQGDMLSTDLWAGVGL